MPIRFVLVLAVLLLAIAPDLPGQKNHNLNWKTGASPNVFDTVEKQGSNSHQLSPGEQKELRQQREAKIAELSRELDQIARAATDLQERLKAVDPNATVSVELREHGKQLEESARKIHKQIGSL
jgi:t-SNARE complex subunit (syntaxin)